MRVARLAAAAAVTALVAAGCATFQPEEPARPGAKEPGTVTDAINLSGYPPEFRNGFREGCAVARGGSGAKPKGDGPYSVGWNDGFSYCRAKK
jgi:hypothetical protein